MTMTDFVGLGAALAFLFVGSWVSLALLRLVVRYHIEAEGIRVSYLSFTMWYANWGEIRSVRLVAGWQILRPSLSKRYGNKLLGPGIEIRKRRGGVIITPDDPAVFMNQIRRNARLNE